MCIEIARRIRRHAVHSKALIRDTLTGFLNIFEVAQGCRQGECVNCGRAVVSRAYYSRTYMYA